ncbi:MAG TPA: GNAT family N-acetyltransferase, partial [Candidatus Paceibacterota bacterium]|nr:GNAT family N-acetyltransferase [Candidatus Paceibacterota bacterium]
ANTAEIRYLRSPEGLNPSQMEGFFVGWEKRPTAPTLLKILSKSDHVAIAMHGDQVVGFATANSDHVISAHIPLVEVLPEYQGKGIGKTLVELLLEDFKDIYMIDLMCEEDVEGFYEKFGFHKVPAMMLRHYDKQLGEG